MLPNLVDHVKLDLKLLTGNISELGEEDSVVTNILMDEKYLLLLQKEEDISEGVIDGCQNYFKNHDNHG